MGDNESGIIILGIESSCDETAAAIYFRENNLSSGRMLSNIIATQKVHELYGGVVPELASRAHQQNIIPVVHEAIKKAGLMKEDISAIAYTKGPGLLGSLLVGGSFAKGFSMGLNIPLIEVNHIHGHILAHFISKSQTDTNSFPSFPFLCLIVSGGHTQIVLVRNYIDMEVVGQTIDDAAGEAFDKTAKILGLTYPGGPLVDKYAQNGNPETFKFPHPKIPELNFSFSGLKTSVLYFVRDKMKEDNAFIQKNINHLCASVQKTIVDILIGKLEKATKKFDIKEIAIAGGVAANSGLRSELINTAEKLKWKIYIPEFQYCTDNAAMIAIAGYYNYINKRIL